MVTAAPQLVRAQARPAQGAINAIREADIKSDIFTLAGDAMRGREAGTLMSCAHPCGSPNARAAGLLPAGDDGTYFQFWNVRRVRLSSGSSVLLARPSRNSPTWI